MKTPKADKQIAHIARLIQGEVGYFNGWAVSDELEYKACHKAAKKVAAYIKRQLAADRK